MKTKKIKLKAIVLSLGLAAGMMLPASASAQGVFGDMLDNYYAEKEQTTQSGGALLSGNGDRRGGMGIDVNTQDFGQAPLGSGIAILIGAGLGYVALKKKEDEQ